MKLTINGNVNESYVQTLCLMFFPASKFSAKKTDETDKNSAIVDVTSDDEKCTVTVTLSDGVKHETATHTEKFDGRHTKEKTQKIALGKAFFEAGKHLVGSVPPWGILTGVRPAKLVFDYFDKGFSPTNIKTLLRKEYFVNPKKASLLTVIAQTEQKIIEQQPKKSCSMYISIPFCPSRCAYCSFVCYSSKKLLSLLDEYLDKLCLDIESNFKTIRELGMTLSTLYIGGGTPTILSEAQLSKLFGVINKNIDTSSLLEFTLEAGRPDTITAEKLALAKQAGVTRVCVNPQSLSDDVLSKNGRIHSVNDFYRAFEIARNSGITHINSDMIAGLVGDDFKTFSKGVTKLIELGADNLTFHTLCIKSASDFAKIGDKICNNYSEVSKCVDFSQVASFNAGYHPYYIYRQKNTVANLENVGFAKEGADGLYNIFMMEEIHSIFACGAGAVTKLVGENGKIERVFEYKYPFEYINDKDYQKQKNAYNKITEFFSKE